MKLFKFTLGVNEKYGVFHDAQEAYDKRESVDVQFHYTPVEIEEVRVEGYEIILKPVEQKQDTPAGPFDNFSKDELKTYLTDKGIKYHPSTGEVKLRELASKSV